MVTHKTTYKCWTTVMLVTVVVVAVCGTNTAAAARGEPGPLLTGDVVDAAGRVDPTATVTVEAWPTSSVLAALPDGASVAPRRLATTHPDAHGHYAVDPDLDALGAAYVESGGTVDLDVSVADGDGGGAESYSFTAARPGSAAARDNVLVATGSRPQTVGFDLRASTVTTALGTGPARTAPTANAAHARGTTVLSPAIPGRRPAGCNRTWTKVRSYPKRSETFMNLWTVGRATVDEEVGSSHSLGVGVAVTGSGWSASGSVTVEAHSSAGGENTYSHSYALRNNVNYAHYSKRCYRTHHGTIVRFSQHRLSATGLHSLLVSQKLIKDHVWGSTRHAWGLKCFRSNGGTFHKTQGSNITFEAGVDAPFISLSAHASYSRDTTVYWPLPRSGRTWMCGSSTKGPASAPFAGEDKNPGPSEGGCGARCWLVAADPKR